MTRTFKMSEAEKTRIALGVLAVVEEVARMLKAPTPMNPEPTGIYVDDDVFDAVTRRAS